MVATPHAAASILLTVWIESIHIRRSPTYGIALWLMIATASFGSHFILDAIPHYDYSIGNISSDIWSPYKLTLDFLSALIIFLFVFWLPVKKTNKFLQGPITNRSKPWAKENIRYIELIVLASSGVFFAWAPDILKPLNTYTGPDSLLSYFNIFHISIHSRYNLNIWLGLISQIIFSLVLACIAKKISTQNELDRRAQMVGNEFEVVFSRK